MWLKLLLFSFCVLGLTKAENGGNCVVDGINNNEFEVQFAPQTITYDNVPNFIIFEGACTGKFDDLKCASTNSPPKDKYVAFKKIDGNFSISTTDDIINLDSDTDKTNSPLELGYRCTMTCPAGKSELSVLISITDFNSHDPLFNKSSYMYTVAFPIMPNTDFTMDGEVIQASDLDFSNNDMVFTIDPPDFDITTSKDSRTKIYGANIRANKIITSKENLVYTLTATDAGTIPGPRSASVKVTLSIDDANSLDIPSFVYQNDQTDYTFQYQSDTTLKPLSGPIQLNTKLSLTDKNFELMGEMKDKFTITYDPTKKEISLKTIGEIKDPINTLTVLTLKINTGVSDITVSTPIIVYFSTESIKFNEHAYTGSYDDTKHQVNLDKEIVVTSNGKASVSIAGDLSQHFKPVENSKKAGSWLIEVVGDGPTAEELKKYTFLNLVISATNGKDKDTASLLINLPSHVLAFSKILYEAKYYEDDKVNMTDDNLIEFSTQTDNSKVTITVLDSAYAPYFEIIPHDKKFTIHGKIPLPKKILSQETELAVIIKATDTYTNTQQAVVKITLPEFGAPKFTKPYYKSEYKKDQTDKFLDFTDPLTFDNVDDDNTIEITIDDDNYKNNFKVIYDKDQKKWHIQIISPLSPQDVDTLSEIILTMEAKETGVDKTGTSVLVIEIIQDKTEDAPQFTDLYYEAEYTQDVGEYIDFKSDIKFTKQIDPKDLTIQVDGDNYKNNFKVLYDDNQKKWRLHVESPLDDKDIESLSEIILTLQAEEKGVTATGQAVLVIQIIKGNPDDALKFADLFYEAEYNKENQAEYIDFKSDVAFTTKINPNDVTILPSDYAENFAIEYSSDKWRIKIKKPLDSSIFDSKNELAIVMKASLKSTSATGSSVLVISLINSSSDAKDPKFKNIYYTAQYPYQGKGRIPFEQELSFENVDNEGKISIIITDYTDYFKVVYDQTKKAWFIDIKKPLDLNVQTGSVISTLSAKIDGDDKHQPVAAFTLKLPELIAPEFTKSYYKADYTISGKSSSVDIDENIEFSTKIDVDNIAITSDDYSDYFEFYYDGQWKIKSSGILDLTKIGRSNLVVAITATDKTTKLTGTSIIDLKLPNVNTQNSPTFSKTYYTATYNITGVKPFVILDDQLTITNRNNQNDVIITTDSYQKNFKIEYIDSKWTITVDTNLDEATLNANDIVLSLIATDTTTKDIGESTLVMTMPKINTQDAPKFSKAFYQSECEPNKFLDEKISITNRDDFTKISVTILEDEYKQNFQIDFDENAKVWMITVLSLPKTTANDLVLTLLAKEDDKIGQAALVLNFPILTAPIFSTVQYYGTYNPKDVDSFQLQDVKITNKQKQDDIELKLFLEDSDISQSFDFARSDDNVWTITLKDPLPGADIHGKAELILTLSATEKGNDNIGYSTVVISLQDNIVTSDLSFSDVYYSAEYSSTPLNIKLNKEISLKSDEDLSDVIVEFLVTPELNPSTYFKITPTQNQGSFTIITTQQKLPDEILNAQSLTLVLEASLDKLSKAHASLVIDLPIPGDTNSIEFSNVLYEAKYVVSSDGVGSLSYDDTITVNTKEDSSLLKVDIVDSTYKAYFKLTQDSYNVNIILDKQIPRNIFETVTVIPLTLEARSSGTQKVGQTVVNVNIQYNQGTVKFSSVLYNGYYNATVKEATFGVDPISLTTDQGPDTISVEIINEYKKYFSASYKDSVVTLTKTNDISQADLKDISTVSIVLQASIKGSKVQDETIINLSVIKDASKPVVQGQIKFDNIVNTAEYSLINGVGEFKEDSKIGLTTNMQNDNINVKFSDDSKFKDKFSISYKDSVVTVEKSGDLSNEDFQSNTYISLEMIATIISTQQSSRAVLNIRMNNNGGNDNEHISFDMLLYKGFYNVSNNKATLSLDKITIATDETDDNVVMNIGEPYNQFFEVLNTNKIVQISLKSNAAESSLRSMPSLPVVLYAQIRNTAHTATAVVNIVVNDYDNNGQPQESIRFSNPVYKAEYIVDKGAFSSVNPVVITDVLDENIECVLLNEDHGYDKHFQCNYERTRVSVNLLTTIPKSDIKKVTNIPLVIRVFDKKRQDSFGDTVLNVELKHEPEEMNETGYIIAISILSVLMFILLAGTAGFYFYKFRKSRYEKMSEEEYMSKVRFDKSSLKRSSGRDSLNRNSAIEHRRPTGFLYNTSNPEDEPRESSSDPDLKERKKSVAFDENVEKLQIESVNDDDIDKALEEVKKNE